MFVNTNAVIPIDSSSILSLQDLTEEEYTSWLVQHEEAKVALRDRDQKLAASAEFIERKFTLLGATGEIISLCVIFLRSVMFFLPNGFPDQEILRNLFILFM